MPGIGSLRSAVPMIGPSIDGREAGRGQCRLAEKEIVMKKTLILLAVLTLGAACSFLNYDRLPPASTPEARDYLAKAMNTPLDFSVPAEKSDEVWDRIRTFISEYASLKIRTASDSVIETYSPTNMFRIYGYKAVRKIIDGQARFAVFCSGGDASQWVVKTTARNGHILAYYALTGELRPELVKR